MTTGGGSGPAKSLIAVFIDGTMNDAEPVETSGRTNVWRMFNHLVKQPESACLYLPGVGRAAKAAMDADSEGVPGIAGAVGILLDTAMVQVDAFFDGFMGEYFGVGLSARVLAAYAFLCAAREQHPSARLAIVGFSRGAYAGCVLAHFLERAGLVVAKHDLGLHLDTIRGAWTYDAAKLKAMVLSGESNAWQLPDGAEAVQVDFLGCWDTVCAMGAPEHGLNRRVGPRLWGRLLDVLCRAVHKRVAAGNPRFMQIVVPPNVTRARHALALHEYRVAFEVRLWSPPEVTGPGRPTDIVQAWFPGAHADVGGGYAETEASMVPSGLTLHWMRCQMFPGTWFEGGHVTPDWPIHDSSAGSFEGMGPRLRLGLTEPTSGQLRTMLMSDVLVANFSGGRGARTVPCDDSEQRATRPESGGFRPEIAALHAAALDEARLTWLRAELARAAASRPEGAIPAKYADPTVVEALDALSDGGGAVIGALDAAGLAAMVADPGRANRTARAFCYHFALTRSADIAIETVRRVMAQIHGTAARQAAFIMIREVVIDPMAVVLDTQVCRIEIALSLEAGGSVYVHLSKRQNL